MREFFCFLMILLQGANISIQLILVTINRIFHCFEITNMTQNFFQSLNSENIFNLINI